MTCAVRRTSVASCRMIGTVKVQDEPHGGQSDEAWRQSARQKRLENMYSGSVDYVQEKDHRSRPALGNENVELEGSINNYFRNSAAIAYGPRGLASVPTPRIARRTHHLDSF